MNSYNNDSYSTFFQLFKTSKEIEDIGEVIKDRLIITKQGDQGKLYFDYSDDERIEISNTFEIYKTGLSYTGDNVTIAYNNITTHDGISISSPITNSLIFDKNSDIGLITDKDDTNKTCSVRVLTKNLTIDQAADIMTIKRYEIE